MIGKITGPEKLSNYDITPIIVPEYTIQNDMTNQTAISPNEIMYEWSLIHCLYDAIMRKYNTIAVIDMRETSLNIDISSIQLPKHFHILSESHHQIIIIDCMIYDKLFVELSLFLRTFIGVINLLSLNCETFNYQTTSNLIDYEVMNDQIMDIEDTPDKFIKLRNKICSNVYEQYKINNKLTIPQIKQIDNMIEQYPYDVIRIRNDKEICLDMIHYLDLFRGLNNLSYDLKVIDNLNNSNECNYIVFDHDFYMETYPCYKTVRDFKNYEYAYKHFINHGIYEKLLPNNILMKLARCNQQYLLFRDLYEINQIKRLPLDISGLPIIYILTRTHNREKCFQQCVESVISQDYPNIRQIVSYDNDVTKSYVDRCTHIYKIINLTGLSKQLHPNQYIDQFYEALKSMEQGWIIVLDDDDKFMTPNALYYLYQRLTDTSTNKLIYWKLYRNDKYIYPINMDSPKLGEIGSCCYIYHSSMVRSGHWGRGGTGDFTFFKFIFGCTKEHIYVDLPLTGVNYDNELSGWTAM